MPRISSIMPPRRGPSGRPIYWPAARRASPSAITCPQWMTEMRSASSKRKLMSCSIMTIVYRARSRRISWREIAGAVGAQPRGRLVEEQDARLGGERNGDLQGPALAIGQSRRLLPGAVGKAHLIENRRWRPRSAPCPRTPCRRRASGACGTRAAPASRSRCTTVSSNRFMIWNERDDAPVARCAAACRPVMSRPSKPDRAAIGRVVAGQDVEAGRLAGAVRPHDAVDLPFRKRQRDVLQHHAPRRNAYGCCRPRTAPSSPRLRRQPAPPSRPGARAGAAASTAGPQCPRAGPSPRR